MPQGTATWAAEAATAPPQAGARGWAALGWAVATGLAACSSALMRAWSDSERDALGAMHSTPLQRRAAHCPQPWRTLGRVVGASEGEEEGWEGVGTVMVAGWAADWAAGWADWEGEGWGWEGEGLDSACIKGHTQQPL